MALRSRQLDPRNDEDFAAFGGGQCRRDVRDLVVVGDGEYCQSMLWPTSVETMFAAVMFASETSCDPPYECTCMSARKKRAPRASATTSARPVTTLVPPSARGDLGGCSDEVSPSVSMLAAPPSRGKLMLPPWGRSAAAEKAAAVAATAEDVSDERVQDQDCFVARRFRRGAVLAGERSRPSKGTPCSPPGLRRSPPVSSRC